MKCDDQGCRSTGPKWKVGMINPTREGTEKYNVVLCDRHFIATLVLHPRYVTGALQL